MSQLKNTLQAIALQFVDSIVEAIRRSPIEEIEGASNGSHAPRSTSAPTVRSSRSAKTTVPGGRLARRSDDQIGEVVDQIATLLRKHPEGLRAEHIRQELDLDVREVPRVLRTGVESKKLVILSGQKRATTYGLPGSRKVAKTAAKKPAGKKPVKAAAKPVTKKPVTKKPSKKPAAKKPLKAVA